MKRKKVIGIIAVALLLICMGAGITKAYADSIGYYVQEKDGTIRYYNEANDSGVGLYITPGPGFFENNSITLAPDAVE